MANDGRYCVVFHSTTKGKQSFVESRHTQKSGATGRTRELNRGQGFGGWYAMHTCAKLGPDLRASIGLDGARRRKRRRRR